MEKWPPELFVPDELAAAALDFVLDTGRRKPDLQWIGTGDFPPDVVGEGRAARAAWRKTLHERGDV